MARLKITARLPVSRKFGMMVKASSVPYTQNRLAGPIAWMNRPGVGIFPCNISKKPWSIPPSAKKPP